MHTTVIRAATRHRTTNTRLATVITVFDPAAPLVALFQTYKLHNDGSTFMQAEASYSSEADAIARFDRWLAER